MWNLTPATLIHFSLFYVLKFYTTTIIYSKLLTLICGGQLLTSMWKSSFAYGNLWNLIQTLCVLTLLLPMLPFPNLLYLFICLLTLCTLLCFTFPCCAARCDPSQPLLIVHTLVCCITERPALYQTHSVGKYFVRWWVSVGWRRWPLDSQREHWNVWVFVRLRR